MLKAEGHYKALLQMQGQKSWKLKCKTGTALPKEAKS